MSGKADVIFFLGSANDAKYVESGAQFLKKMGVPLKVVVASAHRSPERVLRILKEHEKTAKVVVAFAGHAAHLAGVLAAHTVLPVLAVPLPTSALLGLDSLLASVQMPGGIPVGTLALGESGSLNAGCLAAQILALSDPALREKLIAYRNELAEKTAKASTDVEAQWQA